MQDFSNQLVDFRPLLIQRALKFTKNLENAKDLVQETLIRALVYQEKFHQNTNLKAWLFIIMRNLFINDRRNQLNRKTDYYELETLDYLNEKSVQNKGPVQMELQEVQSVIDKMDKKSQKALAMRAKGYSYKEIAQVCKEPEGTIKSRVFYGRKRLQKLKK